jgi:hypothetical protein
MTDHERIKLLARLLYTLCAAAERALDSRGGEHEDEANVVEGVLDELAREFDGLQPIKQS